MSDLGLVRKPDPQIIQALYAVTDRERTPWDAETVLMMAIMRESMAYRATKKDCEMPYIADIDESTAQDRNDTAVGSFFKRFFKGKK